MSRIDATLAGGTTDPYMCPHCAQRFAPCDLIPTHDWPEPMRQVCPGSRQNPRSIWDRRRLWNGELPPEPAATGPSPEVSDV